MWKATRLASCSKRALKRDDHDAPRYLGGVRVKSWLVRNGRVLCKSIDMSTIALMFDRRQSASKRLVRTPRGGHVDAFASRVTRGKVKLPSAQSTVGCTVANPYSTGASTPVKVCVADPSMQKVPSVAVRFNQALANSEHTASQR